jgi:mRNA interferase YafQ
MFTVTYTNTFQKEWKNFRFNKKIESKLIDAVNELKQNWKLHHFWKDHALKWEWIGHNEFHLFPDLLVVYKKNKEHFVFVFMHIGSHSDLFG